MTILPLLREAATLDPDNARYAYVYAVALNFSSSVAEAKEVLARTKSAPNGQKRFDGIDRVPAR